MKAKLVNNSQVKSALKVKGLSGSMIASAAMAVCGINRINRIYAHISDYKGIEFAEKLIEHLNIQCSIDPKELEYIPKEGPFIIVSNHPYGAIDGLIMLKTIGRIRPDIKILTNFLLSYVPNLEESFFPVNPFTDRPGLKSSFKGLKMATEHLRNGGVLGLFPAGEVSSNSNPQKKVKDIHWQASIIKLIQNAGVPVIPMFFSGQNSAMFHFLGKIHPLLRTVRLPHELSNKKNKSLSLKIGLPVPVSEIEEYSSIQKLGRYLWNRTYALEANIAAEQENAPTVKSKYTVPVSNSVEREKLVEEIASIKDERLFEVGSYECYLTNFERIPSIITELGIKREIAFRAVGEGTNRNMDIDKYDTYYKHLILWDKEKKAVVGAYRLGFGREILKQYGRRGFYSHTLFRYKRSFKHQLKRSIELGRSFVALEYQKDPLALMLLIKGLFYTVIKYRHIKYLIGPVSISSWYPPFYRSLIIYYLQRCYSLPQFEEMISPKNPFTPDYNNVDPDGLLESKISSLEKFDRFIYRISNSTYRMPTLLKKYLKINARIIGYNVDPDFNYCVDGLIMLSLNEIPRSEVDALSKEFEDKNQLYKRFDISSEQ